MSKSKNSNIIEFGKKSSNHDFKHHEGSIETIYQKHWREICHRLRKVFGDGPPEPEDLAQEAFANFTSMPNYHYVQNPRAFIFKAALNLGYNKVKRISVARRFIESSLNDAGESLLEENSPENVYNLEKKVEALKLAIDELSEKQRIILARSRIYGQTYAQISQATGWSLADISRQLNSALKILQLKMNYKQGD